VPVTRHPECHPSIVYVLPYKWNKLKGVFFLQHWMSLELILPYLSPRLIVFKIDIPSKGTKFGCARAVAVRSKSFLC
jgi:hypothetical protein